MDRPVQMIYREVEGLPKGSVKAVIDAYGELVDEGCLVVFGPNITDNCVPMREAIEERFKVPAISVTGTDDWLGEWTFAFPQGSMTDEPIFLGRPRRQARAHRDRRPGRAEPHRRELSEEPAECVPPQGHSDRRGGGDRPDGAGHQRSGAHPARGEGRGDRAPRVRLRHRLRQPGARGSRLGPAAVHHHRVPERMGQPDHVERVHGLGRGRPVRRGEPDRTGLPGPLRREVQRQPSGVLRDGGEPRRRRHAGARVHRRPSAEPARSQGGTRAGQDAARRLGRTGNPCVAWASGRAARGWARATSSPARSTPTASTRTWSTASERK